MQRVKSRKSALKPCEHQSLFKFYLHFQPQTEEYARKAGKPWVWYSFDMPDERDMFAPGLPADLRRLHVDLLKRTKRYEGLQAFLAECYPVWRERADADPILTFYLPQHLLPHTKALSAQYGEPLNAILYQLGIAEWRMQYTETSRTVPGFCPTKVPNYDFYGIKAFEQNQQIAFWFASRKLRLAQVFDHRCYHDGNLLGTIDQTEYPAPSGILMPPPRVLAPGQHTNATDRTKQTLTVSSLLKGLVQPAL